MRVVIFGTGKMYQKAQAELRQDIEVVAFLDNDSTKWGKRVDGIQVYPPQAVCHIRYDMVFLLSAYYKDMRKQLTALGVLPEKIYACDQMERICECKPVKYFKTPVRGEKKKIVVFSHALTSTGAQNVLCTAVEVLCENGYRVVVVSKQDGILRERFLQMGVSVVIMENPHMENPKFKSLVEWSDIIWINTIWLYYVAAELIHLNTRVIWWLHETICLEYLRVVLNAGMNNLDIRAVGPLVKKRALEAIEGRLDVRELLYGLPRYGITEIKTNQNVQEQKKIFAAIGGIGRIKGQDVLIHAIGRLRASIREKAEFWIVGAGQLDGQDKEYVDELSCIKLLGEIKHEEMGELYARIDVVICSSREDAMPVAVAEGCMNGKLVIVSDATGIAEYITDGKDGLIFHSEDEVQLAELIEQVVNDSKMVKRIGNIARELYEKHFSMEKFEPALLKLLEDRTH